LNAKISKIFPFEDKLRFVVECGKKVKGYEFTLQREARKAKARLIKRLKKDGFKVYLP